MKNQRCHTFVAASLLGLASTALWLTAQETARPEAVAPEWTGKPAVIIASTGRAPWVGFEVTRADEVVRAQLPKLPKGMGFVISAVAANGPARQAGVQAFDVLWKWNDQWLVNEAQLASLLEMQKIGDTVQLTIFRAGEEKKLDVTLGAEPDPRAVVAGPTIESTKTPTMVPQLESPRPLDMNSLNVRLEDGNAVLEMEQRAEGTWLTIADEQGNTVYEGLFDDKANKKIPSHWHDRVDALHRTLRDRIGKKSSAPENRQPDKQEKDISPVIPVSSPKR
jgi:hypothetical protein